MRDKKQTNNLRPISRCVSDFAIVLRLSRRPLKSKRQWSERLAWPARTALHHRAARHENDRRPARLGGFVDVLSAIRIGRRIAAPSAGSAQFPDP